jgi:RIO-like serine/threonine protein kinase
MEEYVQIGKKIGVGAYAEVYNGMYMGTDVAIKRFVNKDVKSFKAFLTELDIQLSMKRGHPNIIMFMGGY